MFSITDQNRFNKKLKDTVGVEREKLILDIELQDKTASAEWFYNGEPIQASERLETLQKKIKFTIG